MKLLPAISFLVAVAAAPAMASASTVLLDFEQNWQYGDAIDNVYAANGVSFTNVLGVSNDNDFTYYSGAPSMVGVAMAQLDGVLNTTAFLNVAAGVDSTLSFYYASPSEVLGAVKAYSGLNGTGDLLGSFDLVSNGTGYDVWTSTTFNFTGVARSFDLTGSANVVGLDNISITAVPEPESYALALLGLGLVAALSRRTKPQ
ncbi:PEP-CTERM sorting domain-containing protein [Aquabacterium sp.]|uniref:PEP-CTERM sorting domain-containing protein n=1 Tax=Aquabacterium sp. TaxID=1872578 RepID=UPI0019C12314|nr:PEP-CTERM sorting domain-containing protein [Aquabacterium sp.]MBC7702293.1 PEP-CTERM sorting domain-containing protein [Aquabacterium sp.]